MPLAIGALIGGLAGAGIGFAVGGLAAVSLGWAFSALLMSIPLLTLLTNYAYEGLYNNPSKS